MEIQEFIQGVSELRDGMLRIANHYLNSRDDAEDAVQDSLLKLWMARDRIADRQKMRNMAAVICRNVSLNMLRDNRPSIPLDEVPSIALPCYPHERLEEHESHQKLMQCICQLNDRQRAIIWMRNVEELTYADIACIMGTTESSVRGMMSKARKLLVSKMKEEDG